MATDLSMRSNPADLIAHSKLMIADSVAAIAESVAVRNQLYATVDEQHDLLRAFGRLATDWRERIAICRDKHAL